MVGLRGSQWSICNICCWNIIVISFIFCRRSTVSDQMSTVMGSPVTWREKLLVGVVRLLEIDDHLAFLTSEINNVLK